MRTSAGYLFMGIYKKPPFEWAQQLESLIQKGLVIDEPAHSCFKLVSYQRFSGYLAAFYLPERNSFRDDTTFERAWELYEFDRELRLLVLDAIERIEVAFRTALSETMSMEYSSHWFLQAELFKNPERYKLFIKKAKEASRDPHDAELRRYYARYSQPDYPPSWLLFEKLSFGVCTNLFRNLKHVKDRRAVSKWFGYHPTVLASWIESIRYTRNLCAHHARLWNRWFVSAPILTLTAHNGSPNPSMFLPNSQIENVKTTFKAQAAVMYCLLEALVPGNEWQRRLFMLFEKYPQTEFDKMGFDKDWRHDNFWQ